MRRKEWFYQETYGMGLHNLYAVICMLPSGVWGIR